MTTPSSTPSPANKTTGTPAPASTASARLEKTHPGVRRSTPDSEALASSDDDGDHSQQQHQVQAPTSVPAPKPTRRTSWLNEVPLSLPRKASMTGGVPLPAGGSNPGSPAGDPSSWTANTSPGFSGPVSWNPSGGNSFPWGAGIWNTESRKEPPSRLSELVPSPTMTSASVANNALAEDILSPNVRGLAGESSIPFSIPLHPTPKTYRSQSYSVGQLDLEVMANKSGVPSTNLRSRPGGQFSALQRRPSRPSLLGGELSHVREDEDGDDEGSPDGSDENLKYSSQQARTIEKLTRENAILRQAAGQLDGRLRDRAMSSTSAAGGFPVGGPAHGSRRFQGIVPEEADLAVEDLDELGDIPGYGHIRSNQRRRFSEYSANLEKPFTPLTSLENRALENVKKAHWQTSLGFGSITDLPQSRRHSFADIPIRHPSISSASEMQSSLTPRASLADHEDPSGETAISQMGQNQPYFTSRDHALHGVDPVVPSSLQQAYPLPNAYIRQQSNLSHPHQNQLLYIVTFKCHRADVFYIQEDTGLQVKPGDLVIVEADRGTDLGTIQHANVTLSRAKELKQQYAEEHYKWLMMFSRQAQSGASGAPSASGTLPGLGRSAIGAMGPHGPHSLQESTGEIKPKLIKRLAQNHEILTLRDKEGNEAKAKRVCQQKVAEHRLNMEILDAEFQMDWKKLTFYYFAESYINFNSLVTDLFKIYKTRIWMSAINPASFVTPPSAGLQPPSTLANSLMYGPEQQADRRHHDARTHGSIRDGLETGRDVVAPPVGMLRNVYADAYQPFGPTVRPSELSAAGFNSALQSQVDPFGPYSPAAYNTMDPNFVDYTLIGAGSSTESQAHSAQSDWSNRFQGLSLGS